MLLQKERSLANSLGLSVESLYRLRRIHKRIIGACTKSHYYKYTDYGGRGIKVCNAWLDRMNFIAWAVDAGYSDELTIERLDVNGHYEPANCSWVPRSEQPKNRRISHKVEYNNQQLAISDLAALLGIPVGTLRKRLLVYKMPLEKALTQGRIVNWKHGTRTGYEVYKCRCAECTASNTARHKARRNKLKQEN